MVNIAATLVKHFGKKVLMLDCDSQMTTTKYVATYTDRGEHTIKSVLVDDVNINDAVVQLEFPRSLASVKIETTNLFVLPSCIDVEQIPLEDVYVLKRNLDEVESDYDFCLVDMPPHISGVSMCAAVAADYIVVPANADVDSLEGFGLLIDTVNRIRENEWNLNLEILGIMFNDVNLQRWAQKSIFNKHRNTNKYVFNTYIKSVSGIEKARVFGLPLPYIGTFDRDAEREYINLTQEILDRIGERKNG